MANTLTNLIPDAYIALDQVVRELVGFIPAVSRDPRADRVPVGQTLRIPVTPANAAGGDVTPAMSLPNAAFQTIGNKTLTITKSRWFPFSWTGEEQAALDRGPGFLTIQQDQIAQAIRAAMNEIESDIAEAAYKGASRAYGTPGTTPFASDLSDTANIKKILDDNGVLDTDRHLVINTTAGVKVRTLTQLTKVNESGSEEALRRGSLLDVHGFGFRESAQVKMHVKGTGTGYVLDGAHAAGATTITVKTGSGTIVAGDIVTINSVKYVVNTALSGGSFVIGSPGLLAAGADGDTVSLANNYTANVGFTRNSILLATRLPYLPPEGDMAAESEVITDPITGISLDFRRYPGDHMNTYRIEVAWGVTVKKSEGVAVLIG